MRLKVGFGILAFSAATALAGCGHGNIIGSAPLPTPTPNPPGVTAEFPIGANSSQPTGIVLGVDGNLYFAEMATSAISAFTLSTDLFKSYATTPSAGPVGVTVGPDSNIWFTESSADKVGTISVGLVKEFPLPAGVSPAFITPGPGSTLFFTEPANSSIGWISTTVQVAMGPFTTITPNADPLGIVTAPDNNVYFTEYNVAQIGRFNPLLNKVDKEIALPAGSVNPTDIVVGPDSALWFTENNPAGPKIGRLSTATNSITEYALTGAASATSLVVGLDNNFYFVDPMNNAIGSFNLNTQKTAEYKIPTANSQPAWITLGPDGKLYFTEQAGNKIGQFTYF